MSNWNDPWLEGDTPKEKGWYAISYCWDIEEGILCGAGYWSGTSWSSFRPIYLYFGTFASEEDAINWAYEHDVEEIK